MPLFMLALASDSTEIAFHRAVSDSISYSVVANVTIPAGVVTLKSTNIETVKSVSEGEYTLTIDIKDASVSFNGQTAAQGNVHTDRKYHKNGLVIEITGDNIDSIDAVSYRRDLSTTLMYPSKPVKPGDKWSTTIDTKFKRGVPASTIQFTLDGVDKGLAHVIGDYAESGIPKPMKVHSDFWVDTATGRVLKKRYKVTNLPLDGIADPVAATVEYKSGS